MTDKKLTLKQELFCREYLKDFNATRAAIEAGYSENAASEIGWENLRKPQIQEFIQQKAEERAKRVEIDADYVLSNIKTIGERCMQAEPVKIKIDGEEQETGEYKFDSSGALKSQELLGKHLSLFTEKVEHGGDININVNKRVIDAGNND